MPSQPAQRGGMSTPRSQPTATQDTPTQLPSSQDPSDDTVPALPGLAATKLPSRIINKRPKLDLPRLLDDNFGIPVLLKSFSRVIPAIKLPESRKTGIEDAAKSLHLVMNQYKQWAHDLFSPSPFAEVLTTIESLGQTQKMKDYMRGLRFSARERIDEQNDDDADSDASQKHAASSDDEDDKDAFEKLRASREQYPAQSNDDEDILDQLMDAPENTIAQTDVDIDVGGLECGTESVPAVTSEQEENNEVVSEPLPAENDVAVPDVLDDHAHEEQ